MGKRAHTGHVSPRVDTTLSGTHLPLAVHLPVSYSGKVYMDGLGEEPAPLDLSSIVVFLVREYFLLVEFSRMRY